MTRFADYKFTIDSVSPDELSMARLAAYIGALAHLMGHEDTVHFGQLERGSTVVVAKIAQSSVAQVRERVGAAAHGDGNADAVKAWTALDDLLYDDDAVGELTDDQGAQILSFPGRTRPKPPVFGPFNQDGALAGTLVRVGGRDRTAHALLRDGATSWRVEVARDMARDMAPYLFQPVRVHGLGRWRRASDATWQLVRFRADRFEVLGETTLSELMTRAQDERHAPVEGDPLDIWHDLRGNRGEATD